MNNLALAFVTLILAVVLAASAFGCASESEPEGEEPAAAASVSDGTVPVPQFGKDPTETKDTQDTKASREGHLIIGNLVDMSPALTRTSARRTLRPLS